MQDHWRHLEINGGKVINGNRCRLLLQPDQTGYSDAQFDDYGGKRRGQYPWMPETRLSIKARFSHPKPDLVGTAGFGFWNAPFGDPTVFMPALPRAAWFFFASYPSDLPLTMRGPGRGWFVSTIDASAPAAWLMAPFALPIIVLNNFSRVRNRLWPKVRQRLNITFSDMQVALDQWHTYRLEWRRENCQFWIDDQEVASTNSSPKGPLGFVCWMDNQFMIVTNTGRLRWGTLSVVQDQWLEVEDLKIARF